MHKQKCAKKHENHHTNWRFRSRTRGARRVEKKTHVFVRFLLWSLLQRRGIHKVSESGMN